MSGPKTLLSELGQGEKHIFSRRVDGGGVGAGTVAQLSKLLPHSVRNPGSIMTFGTVWSLHSLPVTLWVSSHNPNMCRSGR